MSESAATVKIYLNQLRTLEAVISARKKQLDRLRKERVYISGVRYDRDRIQSGEVPDPNRVSDKLLDLELEIANKVEQAVGIREKIIAEVGRIENPLYVTLLLHRYVDGMRFEEIACEMGYSYGHVTHLHGEALQAFGRLKND